MEVEEVKTIDFESNDLVMVRGDLAGTIAAAETEVAEYPEPVLTPRELTYTDQDAQTQTFLSNADAKDLLLHRASWKYSKPMAASPTPTIGDLGEAFYREYRAWWSRRGPAFGWLSEMLSRRDYDPLENYDRKEEGGWSDTTDIGARGGTHNLTDTYVQYTDTDTETPTVKTKETVTPTVKSKETVTPTVKTKQTETPAVTDTTVETPGVSTTVAESVYGDNSSTEVPLKKIVTSPGANQSNQTQLSHSGTNTTTNEVLSGDTQTVNEILSGNTETVNEVVSGNTQTTRQHGAHTDTHNTSTTEQAAQDVLTRLFDEYRVHGNIGVSTVADMVSKEIAMRAKLDLHRMAIEEITDQLCYLAE